MSVELISLIIIGGLLVLLVAGAEIAVAMGVMAAVGMLFFMNQSIDQFAYISWDVMNRFSFTAIPLFIFMGLIFSNTGIIHYLFDAMDKLIGFVPGGLVSSALAANGLFGAVCGSSVAAAATFGAAIFPEMERRGYDPKLALGSIAMGGTLSVLIPPSLVMLVYGGYQEVSVVRLFAGGIIPGVMLTIFFIITTIIVVKTNPRLVPPERTRSTWREKLIAIRELLPWIAVIVIVLGVIFGGIMTPTEAAAMGAFLAVMLALAYRRLTYKALRDSLLTAVKVTAMMAFLIVIANVIGYVFHFIGLTGRLSELVLAMPLGTYGILAVMYLIFIILGCFMEGLAIILIMLPFVAPIITHLGFSLVWFGVTWVIIDELGLVTPPFGLNLFALQSVAPKYELLTIARGTLPFYPAVTLLIILVTIWPDIIMWLPNLLYPAV